MELEQRRQAMLQLYLSDQQLVPLILEVWQEVLYTDTCKCIVYEDC